MAINPRLQHLFDQSRSSYGVLAHREVFTAPEVARSVPVMGRQLAKVVVMRDGAGDDFLVVLPASRHLDARVLRRVTGRDGIQLEDEPELRRLFPDCEVGAMPPFGALYGLSMFLDPCLLRAQDIFFQAGNHREVVFMNCDDYQRLAGPFHASGCLHRKPRAKRGSGSRHPDRAMETNPSGRAS